MKDQIQPIYKCDICVNAIEPCMACLRRELRAIQAEYQDDKRARLRALLRKIRRLQISYDTAELKRLIEEDP